MNQDNPIRPEELTLPEQLLLLAYDDEKGKAVSAASNSLSFGLAGAVLMELMLEEVLTISGEDLKLEPGRWPAEPLLKETVRYLEQNPGPKSAKKWIEKLSSQKQKLLDGTIDRLVERGILAREEKKVLWLFPVERYPEHDSLPERRIRKRIRAIVLDGEPPNETEAFLISLVKACNLVGEVFARPEVKPAEEKIDSLIESEQFGQAIGQKIQEVQMAMVVAASTAATTAAIAGSH